MRGIMTGSFYRVCVNERDLTSNFVKHIKHYNVHKRKTPQGSKQRGISLTKQTGRN